jgi:hypothetical protein
VDFLSNFQGAGASDIQGLAMAKATNVALRTLCLDTLAASPPTDAEAMREWIAEEIDETTMMDELPRGPDEAGVAEAEISTVRKFLDDLAERIQLAGAAKTSRRSAGRVSPLEQTSETAVRSEEKDVDNDFPVPGTPEWGRMNRRRGELIRKKNRQGLSPDELTEYERLQRLSHETLEAQFPRPSSSSEADTGRR